VGTEELQKERGYLYRSFRKK